MNLLFNSTVDFDKDLKQFDGATQQQIGERINQVAQAFVQDKRAFAQQARQPYRVKLNNNYDSSLYSLRVEPEVRVVLTLDDDPLFDQVIVTLLRVVRGADLEEAYKSAAEALYQHLNGHEPKQGVDVG